MMVALNKAVLMYQHNCAHRIHVHDTLMTWLQEETKEWILAIQEPYMSKKGIPRLPNNYCAYWSTYPHGSITKTRTVIIAPKALHGYMVNQHSNVDCTVVRFDRLQVSVISLYCAGDISIDSVFEFVKKENEVRKNIVLCVDTNAYHCMWGSIPRRDVKKRKNERGNQIATIMDEIGMDTCNDTPHLPTYAGDTRGGESHIDATFCTAQNTHHISNWKVHADTLLSDHRYITFQYGNGEKICDVQAQRSAAPWRKPSKKMELVMEKMLHDRVKYHRRIANSNDVDMFIDRHVLQVTKVLKDVFCKSEKHKNNSVFWWTEEVKCAYGKLKLARRRMERYRHESLVVEYRRCRNRFKYAVDKAKLDAWREFTNSIDNPWEGLMRIVKSTSTGRSLSKTLADLHGRFADDLKQTLVILGNQFYPSPSPLTDSQICIERQVNKRLRRVKKGENITVCEFREALSCMSKATAPGFDTITNNVIRVLAVKCKFECQYIQMFNTCLQQGIFPGEWKKAKIVLIPKASTMMDSVKALRPISLTSAFSKLFERVILARMVHHLEMSGKITKHQHAYRKGGSTNTALYDVFNVVQCAMNKKHACVIVFLDISGAFDRTWHHGILHKLLEYNVPTYIVAWIREFLSGRTALFSDGSETYEMSLQQGCPQGGVLSPVLWNVMFNEMLQIGSDDLVGDDSCMKTVGYADDAAIVCRAPTTEQASKYLTEYLKRVSSWAECNRVVFNASKLAVMGITTQRAVVTPTAVYFNGTMVNEVESYKYLGLTVDSKLSWKPHINNVLSKLAGITKSLRGVARKGWGVKLHVMRLLFSSIFLPVMFYGIVIWGWRASFKNVCIQFDKEIRAFSLMATRCLRTTSSEVLFRLLHTLPFSQLLRNEVLKVSILQFGKLTTERQKIYETYAARVTREAPRSMDHFLFMCRRGFDTRAQNVVRDDIQRNFIVHPAQRTLTTVCVQDTTTANWKGAQSGGWVIFTDASTSSYSSGWAYAAFKHGFCVSYQYASLTRCSIFVAEAYAILQAILYARKIRGVRPKEIIEIRTDAQSVVQALKKLVHTDKLLGSISDCLRAAAHEGINVMFRWIPSHSDIQGNDFADRLAKKAVDSKACTTVAVEMREVRQMIKEREGKVEVREWGNVTSTIPKAFLPTTSSIKAFTKAMPSIALCQLVTGHTRLKHFAFHKLGLTSSSHCTCSLVDETVQHYLFDCTNYAELREEIWCDFEPSFEYITQDWKKLDEFVIRSGRFNNTTVPLILPVEDA